MATSNLKKQSVFEKWIHPLSSLFQHSIHTRECQKLTDRQWIEIGLMKIVSGESTGRAFLQSLSDAGRHLKRSLFFETLKSKRRLRFCREVDQLLFDQIRRSDCKTDPLRSFSVLDEYDLYAGDGHYHAASAHDLKKEGKKYPVQHFYALDLRTHALKHLIGADVSGQRKKEHDIRALKRLGVDELRQGAPKGRKVVYVWDRAGIDFLQWHKWKQSSGIYLSVANFS